MIASLFGLEQRTMVVTGVDVRQDSALNAIFGQTGATVAKVNVTEETAQTCSAVYACVRLLSTTVGHLPFKVYKHLDDKGDREIAREHDLYEKISLMPNPEMTSIFLRQSAMAYTLLWGRHYSYLERDAFGKILGIWPMRTNDVRRLKLNGTTYYDVSKVEDNDLYPRPPLSEKYLNRYQVLELTTFDGQSIIAHAREQIGEAIGAQLFGAGFFAGGAQPYLYIKHPGVLRDPDKLRANWQSIHSGIERNVAVLEEGMDIGTIGMPLDDAQFLESREFYVTDVARWFGVPPHKIGDLKRATFSNIEEQNLEWRESLLPWLEMIEQEYEFKCFTDAERKRYFVEHVTDELLRGNTIDRYQAHSLALQWGWKSRNEVRRAENLNAIEDGDTYLVPSNMVTSKQMEEGSEKNAAIVPDDDEDNAEMKREAARTAVESVLNRLFEREKTEIRKAAGERRNFIEWIEDFYAKWPEKITTALRPADAVCRSLGAAICPDDAAIRAHCGKSLAALLDICGSVKPDGLLEAVEKGFTLTDIDY